VGLFAAPLIAVGVFASIRSRWPSAQRRIATICIFAIVVILGGAALGFSFKNVLLNFVCFVIAYGAYCFLAVSCWRIKFLPLRIPALLGAAIPICAGYFMCTVGLLGLMFIVGDYTRAPESTEQIDTGLECRVTGWGMVASVSGYTV